MAIPCVSCPTSVSSMLPRKMRSLMSATVAIVVPSLNVLLRITELPTFTGTSKMRPLMVERMSVLLALALLRDTPSRTTSSASTAAFFSSCACSRACRTLSYSSALTSCLSKSCFSRPWFTFACFRLMSARRTRASAELSWLMSGITLTLAITSPASTVSPASLYISVMMPLICGFTSTSSRGSIEPVITVVLLMSATFGVNSS